MAASEANLPLTLPSIVHALPSDGGTIGQNYAALSTLRPTQFWERDAEWSQQCCENRQDSGVINSSRHARTSSAISPLLQLPQRVYVVVLERSPKHCAVYGT
jgi:hypothetical protein